MTIKSFVLRQGRMTTGQERAFTEHWHHYGIDITPEHPLDPSTLFNTPQPLVLEIGFGNGDSLLSMAEAEPNTNFIGIEVHRPGIGHALRHCATRDIDNVRMICHDAVDVLTNYISDNSLSRVQVFFPDPWPKARHHKRRLIQTPFTNLIHQKLTQNGELHCATDWQHYADWMKEVFINQEKWINLGDETGFAPKPPWRPLTKFEQRGLNKGHGVWDLRYQANKE